jgi:hypothetical protein
MKIIFFLYFIISDADIFFWGVGEWDRALYIAQDGLKLKNLPWPPECWGSTCAPLHLAWHFWLGCLQCELPVHTLCLLLRAILFGYSNSLFDTLYHNLLCTSKSCLLLFTTSHYHLLLYHWIVISFVIIFF